MARGFGEVARLVFRKAEFYSSAVGILVGTLLSWEIFPGRGQRLERLEVQLLVLALATAVAFAASRSRTKEEKRNKQMQQSEQTT